MARVDTFETYTEFVNKAKSNPHPAGSVRKHNDQSWDYMTGWDGALRLAQTGWPEGTARIVHLKDSIEASLFTQVSRPELQQDVTGLFADPGLVAEGIPECCYYYEDRPVQGEAVKIVINGASSAAIDAKVIERRGAAVVALVNALELAGRTSEVWWVCATDHAGTHCEVRLCVKRADEPAQMDQLAFVLAHPAHFRRLYFAVAEALKYPLAQVDHGAPTECTLKGDILLERAHKRDTVWDTDESAAEQVAKWLRQFTQGG